MWLKVNIFNIFVCLKLMNNHFKYCCLTLFFFFQFLVEGKTENDPSKDFLITANAHYGYIMSHRSNMTHLIRGHVKAGELQYTFRTNGKKPWHQLYKFPEMGLSFMHFDLANPRQLGTLEAFYPYVNFKLNKLQKKSALNLRIGIGLAYLTNPFNIKTNHKNNAIGSHFNGFVNLRLNYAIRLSDALRMEFGAGLSHASNGAMKMPNLGLNIATANLGFTYFIGDKYLDCKKDTIAPCKKVWNPSLIVVAGMKELEPPTGRKYFAYGLQANIYRTLGYKSRIGAGAELTYNEATKQVWADASVNTTKFEDIAQVGVKFGYEFRVHRFALPIDFGYYVFKKQSYNGKIYHRVGMRYMLTKNIIANLTLRTHWAKADYFEWGLGYQF